MALKLKLASRDPRLALALKAVLVGGLLALASAVPSWGIFPILLYIAGAFFLFKGREPGAPATFGARFLFVAGALLLARLLVGADIKFLLYLFVIGIAYAIFGLQSLFFIRRREWNYALRLFISYVLFVAFFSVGISGYFLPGMIVLFLSLSWLWKEFFNFSGKAVGEGGMRQPSASGKSAFVALLSTEAVWLSKLLPLSIVNAANFSFLILFAVSSMALSLQEKSGSRRNMLFIATVVVLGMLAIFALTKWTV